MQVASLADRTELRRPGNLGPLPNQKRMRNRRSTNVVASLISLGAVVFTFLSIRGVGPETDTRLYSAIGHALAQEVLALSGPGGQVVVITRDTATFKQPAVDILMDSFRREVGRGQVAIGSIHRIQVDPLRPLEAPAGDFFELIRKAPNGSVIVSFMGPPLLSEDQIRQLDRVKPKIVAFCPGNFANFVDLRGLFERQLLHAAVVSRPNSPETSTALKTPPRTFEQLYVSVTAANLSNLPAPAVNGR